MKTLRIDYADVILNDLGDGKGKIIISDDDRGYNFSYYWGAMAQPLEQFICKINPDYFADKLGPSEEGEINSKKTLRNIRKALREDFNSEYPWYTQKEFQANLREELKNMEDEGFSSIEHYMHSINNLLEYKLDYYLIEEENKNDWRHPQRDAIKSLLESIFNESWHYVVHDEHKHITYLKKFHKKLVKVLKKELKKTATKTC